MSYVKYTLGVVVLLSLIVGATYFFPLWRKAAPQADDLAQIKDAYFLTRMAQDRLQYANDLQTAKQLLQLAQDRLLSTNVANIRQVRNILAADQAKLNVVPSLDLQDLNNKLDLLDDLITRLSVPQATTATQSNEPNKDKVEAQKEIAKKDDKSWVEYLDKITNKVKNSVKIKRRSSEDAVDLNIDMNKARLRLLVEQLRWAVVYNDSNVYNRSIKAAQQILSSLDLHNQDAVTFAQTLQSLENVQLQTVKPNIDDALNALQTLLVG